MADVIDALIAEALGEGPEGIAAVAHVIQARAQATGKTPEQIVNESGQFSGVSNPGRVVAQSMRDPAVRQQVGEIWNGVQSGLIPNPYPGATHFHTPEVSPSWANSFERLGKKGNHIFYSDGSPVAMNAPSPAPKRVEPVMPVMRPAETAVTAIDQAVPAWDWSQYATGGAAARSDSFTGLNDLFSQALQRMISDAPEDVKLNIASAYRSPETQARLWEEALAKYGSESEARKWVAPPGRSQHNHGNAVDLKYMSPNAQSWVHANAGKYGLAFPLSNEPWHLELRSARNPEGAGAPPLMAYSAARQPTPAAATAANAARGPQGRGFFGNIASNVLGALPQLNMPTISPQMQRAVIGPLMGSLAGRTLIGKTLMNQNIGAAPSISPGWGGAGAQAYAVNSQGATPIMLSSSGGGGAANYGVNENWNPDVYRANSAVLGGGNITQSNINSALSSGKTLYRLA